MSSKLEIRINRRNLDKILKEADEFNKKYQLVGILDDAPSGLAEVGYKNEFGASAASTDLGKDIPERSFIRLPLEERKEGILHALFENNFWETLVKNGASSILEETASGAVVAIVDQIVSNHPAKKANSPYTLQRKSSTVPLKDKGILESNIKYKEVTSE